MAKIVQDYGPRPTQRRQVKQVVKRPVTAGLPEDRPQRTVLKPTISGVPNTTPPSMTQRTKAPTMAKGGAVKKKTAVKKKK